MQRTSPKNDRFPASSGCFSTFFYATCPRATSVAGSFSTLLPFSENAISSRTGYIFMKIDKLQANRRETVRKTAIIRSTQIAEADYGHIDQLNRRSAYETSRVSLATDEAPTPTESTAHGTQRFQFDQIRRQKRGK